MQPSRASEGPLRSHPDCSLATAQSGSLWFNNYRTIENVLDTMQPDERYVAPHSLRQDLGAMLPNIDVDPIQTAEQTDYILAERRESVVLLTLNRPQALNALCDQLTRELTAVLDATENDSSVGAVVLTGSAKAFAAGADIKEMQSKSFSDVYLDDFITSSWERPATVRKPLIAAVAGYALGGGAELAMMCDFIIAADTARFAQPEITIGVLPGAGGTQRLARSVGKSMAMDMVLTGRMVDAAEAERIGLVARVVPEADLLDTSITVAQQIASHSRPAVLMAKESVDRAFETGLAEGLRFERRLFHAAFATDGQREGMAAFVEKREPQYTNR